MIRVFIYLVAYIITFLFSGSSFTFLLTAPQLILTLFAVSRIRNKYFGVLDILWLVLFLYFCLAPIQNIAGKSIPGGPLGLTRFDDSVFFLTSLVVFIFTLSLHLTLYFTQAYLLEEDRVFLVKREAKLSSLKLLFLVGLFFLGLILYVIFQGGINNVLSSRLEKDITNVVAYGFIPTALSSVTISFLAFYIKNKMTYGVYIPLFLFVVSLCACFFIFNPTQTSRYVLLSVWLPVFFILNRDKVTFKFLYLVMFVGVFFIMPVLSAVSRRDINALDISTLFNSGSFDGLRGLDIYDMALYGIYYTNLPDFTFGLGRFLLPVFLFIVPRSIWNGKPTPFAPIVSEHAVYSSYAGTSNLSMPFFMDGYADFFLFGVLLMAILFGFIIRKVLDYKSPFGQVFVVIFLSSIPIIIRGPFNGITGLLTFQFVFYVLILYFLRREFRFKGKYL